MIGGIIGGALGLAHKIFQAAAPVIIKIAPWALVALLGALLWHQTPRWGPAAQIQKLELDRDAWKNAAGRWEANAVAVKAQFDKAEALREEEGKTAASAVIAQAQQCAAEVAAARSSARVIERIINKESRYDADRCPIRESVDANSLRDALAPRPD